MEIGDQGYIKEDENDDDEAFNMSQHKANWAISAWWKYSKNYVDITEIIVPTEWDKQQLLAAFKYIHDNKIIDSNYYAVNTLMHMYEVPDRIRVQAS